MMFLIAMMNEILAKSAQEIRRVMVIALNDLIL
jgi:hypothetical protein